MIGHGGDHDAPPEQREAPDLAALAPEPFEQCERLRVGPNMALFEPGFLRVVRAYERAGRLPPGSFVKFYFGEGLFGLPPTATALAAYLELLEGSNLPWAAAVIGGDLVGSGMAKRALEAGGPDVLRG